MATIKDIAEIAGVSKATVSLALSDHPRISGETKQKIRKIAAEIGYGSHKESAGKEKGRSVGILFFHSGTEDSGNFFKDTLIGITDASQRLHMNAMLIAVPGQPGEHSPSVAELVRRAGVDGVIIISHSPQLYGLDELAASGFPIVFIGRRSVGGDSSGTRFVATDNFGGGKLAVDWLLGLGHRSIAVAVPPRHMLNGWEEDRIDGYFAAMRQAGLPTIEPLIMTDAMPEAPTDDRDKPGRHHDMPAGQQHSPVGLRHMPVESQAGRGERHDMPADQPLVTDSMHDASIDDQAGPGERHNLQAGQQAGPARPGDCLARLRAEGCTAVFAITPDTGLRLLHELRQSGISVPGGMSLIVFDNFPSAELERPPVTVIRQDMDGLGRTALRQLAALIEDPKAVPGQLLLPAQLLVRESCAPPC